MAVDPKDPEESVDEQSCQARAVSVLQRLGYTCLPPAALAAERDSSREVILVDRLVAALQRLNPGLSAANVHRALRELTGTQTTELGAANRRTHALLTQGIVVDQNGGSRRPRTVRYLDLERPADNELVVTWQLPVRGVRRQVVVDLAVFVNGIPLILMMCEPAAATAAADPGWKRAALAELWRWQEVDRADHELGVPRLFESAHLLVALGAQTAVYGTVRTPPHRFAGWRTPWPRTLEQVADLIGRPPTAPDVLLCGMLTPANLLDLVQNLVANRRDPATDRSERTLSRWPEFVAVHRSLAQVTGRPPDHATAGPGGVIWHALGEGGHRHRLLVAWLVGKLRREPLSQARPVLVVTADNAGAQALNQTLQEVGLREPTTVNNREALQRELADQHGCTVLTTAPFLRTLLAGASPDLGAASCPTVLILEAGGTQAGDLAALLRQALPSACVLLFTNTPLVAHDAEWPARNRRAPASC